MPRSPALTPAGKLENNRIGKREAAVLEKQAMQQTQVTYDFSVDGGAIGTIGFGKKLPANAVVTRVWSDELVDVTETTAGATVELQAGGTAISGATIDASALSGVEDQSAAAPVKLATTQELQMEIATDSLTAGKVKFTIEYFISK